MFSIHAFPRLITNFLKYLQEKKYPDEPIYSDYLGKLPSAAVEYRLAPGRTEMDPTHPLIVGCCYSFQFTYFPVDQPLPAGTVVAFSIPRTWSQPQVNVPGPGFIRAERSCGACNISLTQNENLQWWIKLHIEGTGEPVDGWVRMHYAEVTIQRFPQDWFGNWRSAMRTVIDMGGKGVYACVPAKNTIKPVIIAAPPARFNVAVPAVARSGETIRVRAAALDYCDNRAYPSPTGDIFLAEMKAPFTPITITELKPDDHGCIGMDAVIPDNAQKYRLVVSNRRDNLANKSATTVIDNRPETLRVYFGDIHAKTKLSDGLKTPMAYFEHARDVAQFVQDTFETDGGNSRALNRGKQRSTQGVAKRQTESSFQRLDDKTAAHLDLGISFTDYLFRH